MAGEGSGERCGMLSEGSSGLGHSGAWRTDVVAEDERVVGEEDVALLALVEEFKLAHPLPIGAVDSTTSTATTTSIIIIVIVIIIAPERCDCPAGIRAAAAKAAKAATAADGGAAGGGGGGDRGGGGGAPEPAREPAGAALSRAVLAQGVLEDQRGWEQCIALQLAERVMGSIGNPALHAALVIDDIRVDGDDVRGVRGMPRGEDGHVG